MTQTPADTAPTESVIVYGSNWCPHTVYMLQKLDALKVAYKYVDVDEDADAEKRIGDWNNGRALRPTLDMQGDIFVHPGDAIDAELKKRDLIPAN